MQKALAGVETTFPFHLLVYYHLHILDALGTVNHTFVVVPNFETSQLRVFLEVNVNFKLQRRGWQIAHPHLTFISCKFLTINKFFSRNLWSLTLVSDYNTSRCDVYFLLTLIKKLNFCQPAHMRMSQCANNSYHELVSRYYSSSLCLLCRWIHLVLSLVSSLKLWWAQKFLQTFVQFLARKVSFAFKLF